MRHGDAGRAEGMAAELGCDTGCRCSTQNHERVVLSSARLGLVGEHMSNAAGVVRLAARSHMPQVGEFAGDLPQAAVLAGLG